MTAKAYALVEYEERIYCSELHDQRWESIPLHGSVGTQLLWPEAINELNDRINADKALANTVLYLLVDSQSPAVLSNITGQLEGLSANNVSLYPMRWMMSSVLKSEALDSKAINEVLLARVSEPENGLVVSPLSFSTEDPNIASEVEELEAANRHLQADMAEQRRQLEALQKDNDSLRRRLANHNQVLSDGEVNSYLACIFNNYWANISPADHCIFTGQINEPELRSPVMEPADTTLRRVAREIQNLGVDERTLLAALCQKLAKAKRSLNVRHEYQFLLDDPSYPTERSD